jgi:endonuclease/exonuclease/phosphatase family metal-dependent hydrolase
MSILTVATYNVHKWTGTDGRRDMDRSLRVIRGLHADILALQEVTVPHHDELRVMEGRLAESTGMEVIFGPTLIRENASFGNVLLHRQEVSDVRRHDLTVPGREPRGAIEALVRFQDHCLRVVATHLGIRAWERRRQTPRLLEILNRPAAGPFSLLIGDFNHWLPAGRVLSALNRCLGKQPSVPTFPAQRPLLALDRIWVRPRELLTGLRACTSGCARTASDHLPLTATIALP